MYERVSNTNPIQNLPSRNSQFHGVKKIYRLNMYVGSQKGAILLGPEGEKGRDKQN